MAKEPKQRFVLNLKLKTEKWQEDVLNKRFEIGRHLYNSVLGKAFNRYNEMIKTKKWRENQSSLFEIYKIHKNNEKLLKKNSKSFYDIRNEMLKEFRLNEYSLHEDIQLMQHKFKKNIDAFTAQKIASRVWVALDKLIFGDGEEVHFKGKNNTLNSLEGKSNGTGIRYDIETNLFKWNGLEIPTMLDIDNPYEVNCLRNRICFCRIKRKFVRGKYRYILQLVLEGVPPVKLNKKQGK